MTVLTAVALGGLFAGCSNDVDLNGGNTAEFNIVKNYEDAFVTRFGQPAENQTWGFGEAVAGTRANNPGVDYPATSTGINANANEWADPTPGKTFGGWVVPDPLTQEQKDVVMAYFQANPDLTYEDPHLRHFFVQQVYTGGTTPPTTGNKENNVAAGGTAYTSANMNLLTVGHNEQHINNFNAGSYSGQAWTQGLADQTNADGTVNVLDKGYTANDFADHHHKDQIMLMVNIDDTECMGYHNTGSSQQRNDKAALVGWETIQKWANSNGLNGDCLKDGWNRSFVGFDFELYSLEDSYLKDGGNIVYAKMTDGQNGGLQYVWDGKNVTPKGVESVSDLDITSRFNEFWNESESIDINADGTIIYHAAEWGGLKAWLGGSIDFSIYQSLVVEFAEDTPVKTQLVLDFGDEWGSWGQFKLSTDAGVKEFELNFASNNLSNLNKIRQVALQAEEVSDIKISRIYLKGVEGEPGYGNYLLVDGKKVPFLITNMNMYGGELYGGKDEALSDNEMKITVDGKECFNMAKIKELVDDGYLPVKDKNLRTWVKWQGGDGYFSDWIVTLTKADRITTPPTNPDIVCRIIVEDLTVGENSDFDFNDVVFDVRKDGILIIRAIGGELPLYIYGKDDDHEVHKVCLGSLPGDTNKGKLSYTYMSNTGWGSGTGSSTAIQYDANLGEINTGRTFSSTADAKEIGIWVKKASSPDPIELKAPVGKVASKICVGTDYKWCAEREDIDKKYHKDGVKLFHQYVIGATGYGDDWEHGNAWYQKLYK